MKVFFVKIKLAAIVLLFSLAAKAQKDTIIKVWSCGNDSVMFSNLNSDTSLVKQMRTYNNAITTSTATPGYYIIPVVFHIIEPTGTPTTSVTYAQIQWQVAALNAAYQNQMYQFTGTGSGPEAAYTHIEFRLACTPMPASGTNTATINGLAGWTNANEPGVVRYTTSNTAVLAPGIIDPTMPASTYTPMLSMTNPTSSFFPKANYLNIYCVPSITPPPGLSGTVVGFSTFPMWQPAFAFDGIVLRIDALGNNTYPTGFPLNSNWNHGFTLAHEAGHYLGLFHTFQPSIGGTIGTYPVGCYGTTTVTANADGDQVSDTPPTQVTGDLGATTIYNSCNENYAPYLAYGNSMPDVNDQLENFMCYSYDYKINTFTNLQAQRMWGALDANFGSAPRSVLTSSTNLVATGVGTGTVSSCANYTGIVTGIFNYGFGAGTTCTAPVIKFTNPTSLGFSMPSVTSYSWNFGDGSAPLTTTISPVTHTYTSTTTYSFVVSCTATNGTVTNTYSTTISTSFNVSIIGQSSQMGSNTSSTVCKGMEQTIYVQFGIGVPSALLTDGTYTYTVNNYMDLSKVEVIPYLFTANVSASYSLAPGNCGNGVANFNVIYCCPSVVTNGDFETIPTTGLTTDLYNGSLATGINTFSGFGTYTVSPLTSTSYFSNLYGAVQNTTGNMMLIDGFANYNTIVNIPAQCSFNPSPTPRVWQQVVTGLQPNKQYYYSFKLMENYHNVPTCLLNFQTSIASNTLSLVPTHTFTPVIDNYITPTVIDFEVHTYTFTTPNITSPSDSYSITINQINDYQGYYYDYFLDNITLNQMTPGIQAVGSATICPTATVQLTAFTNCANTSTYSYIWTPTVGLSCTTCTNPIASPSTTTVYTLVAVSSNTLGIYPTYVSTATVTVNNSPLISVSGNTALCPGISSTTLTASGASTYTWQPGSSTTNPIIFTPTVTTTYTVSGTNTVCPTSVGTQTVTVTVNNTATTISVTPSPVNICSNNSATILTASGATTYTWMPGSTLNNEYSSSVTASPSSSTTYTVMGTTNGCIGTNTVSVVVYPAPVVTITPSSYMICGAQTTTLTASGATTYSWSNGATTPSIVVTPTVSTSYTAYGTTGGCTGVQAQIIYVLTAPSITVTASPTVICVGQTTTLTATNGGGGGGFSWSPSGSLSSSSGFTVTANPTVTTTYTITNTQYNCTTTFNLLVPAITVTAAPTPICTGQSATLTASGASTYTWNTGANTPSITGIVNNAGVKSYTVSGYSSGCYITKTVTVSVSATPTITISASPTVICVNQSSTVTASGASTYTWTADPSLSTTTGTVAVASPTTTTTYTIAGTGTNVCVGTNTLALTVSGCTVCPTCTASISGTVTASPASYGSYCINNNITISGVVSFVYSEFKIAPNVTITLLPGSALNINNSHLYACSGMWQGIIAPSTSTVAVSLNSLIEDAYVAISSSTSTNNQMATVSLSGSTFNKNQVSLQVTSTNTISPPSGSTYPISIDGCLFTSRIINTSGSTMPNWPATSTIITYSTMPSPLQTPYLNAYTVTTCKNGDYPLYGIELNNVGVTTGAPSSPVYSEVYLGNSKDVSIYDSHYYDIFGQNSNITVQNSVFQNGQYKVHVYQGTGIQVSSTDNAIDNYRLRVTPVSAPTSGANSFYNLYTLVSMYHYLETDITYNNFYSTAASYTTGSGPSYMYGQTGLNLVTNRYTQILVDHNNMYNIATPIIFTADVGNYYNGVGLSNGRYSGQVSITNNFIRPHVPGNTITNQFVSAAISATDVMGSPSGYTNGGITGANVYVKNNILDKVWYGIYASSFALQPVKADSNYVTIVKALNGTSSPTLQYGIDFSSINSGTINYNNLESNIGTTDESRNLTVTSSGTINIGCNVETGGYRGMEFNGTNFIRSLAANTYSNNIEGLALDNSGIITQQGNSGDPEDNQWLGTWGSGVSPYKTATHGTGSSAQNSKIWVHNTSACNPNGSGYTNTGFSGPPLGDDYYSTGAGATLPIYTGFSGVASCPASVPTCTNCRGVQPAMTSEDSAVFNNIKELKEKVVLHAIKYDPQDSAVNCYLSRMNIYKSLRGDTTNNLQGSDILRRFYNLMQNSNMEKLSQVEDALLSGDFSTAQTKMSSVSNANSVENNYLTYYNTLINYKKSAMTASDSTNLLSLAQGCPFTNGNVVYQARALYNIMNSPYTVFKDNCNQNISNRAAQQPKVNNGIATLFDAYVYPNPNAGREVFIAPIGLTNGNLQIRLADLEGRTVYESDCTVTDGLSNIKIAEIKNGVYFVHITNTSTGEKIVKKLVIQY